MPLSPTFPRSAPSRFVTCLALVAVVVLHLSSACWHILFGALNADEGFYAVATRAVAHGEMPYRDFGFSQPPLVLYANALPLRLVGFGLFEQRSVNGLWAALALVVAAVWLGRRTRPSWGVALVLSFSLSAPWMYFSHLGKTYAVTTLLTTLAAWVFLAMASTPRRNFLLGLVAALGVGTRLPAAPFFGVLWLLALWPGRRPPARDILAAAGGAALGLAAIALPFWLAAPDAINFWVFGLQRVAVSVRPWHLAWQEIASLAPSVWLLGSLALGLAALRSQLLTRETGVLLAAGAALAPNLLHSGIYEEYGVPFLLPLAMAAAALVYDECKARPAILTLALAIVLVTVQFFTAPVLFYQELPQRRGTASRWLPHNAPPYNRTLPAQLAAARRIVKESLAPTAPFIGPNLILAVESGRAVPPELCMGTFSVTDEMSAAQAGRLHLATRDQLSRWFTRPEVTVVGLFKRPILNYGWSMPSFTTQPEAARQKWIEPLSRDFIIASQDGDFLLLVRKNFPIPPPQ